MKQYDKRGEWLKNLNVGDEVYVSNHGYNTPFYIEKVEKITETAICLTDKTRYNKKCGVMIKASRYPICNPSYIDPVTDKRRDEPVTIDILIKVIDDYIDIIKDHKRFFSLKKLSSLAKELKPWAEEALDKETK